MKKEELDQLFEVNRLTMEDKPQREIADILFIDISRVQALQSMIKSGVKNLQSHLVLDRIRKLELKILKKAELIGKMERDGHCCFAENKKLSDYIYSMNKQTNQLLYFSKNN
ncbi:MAG: hypothetical protein QG594_2326 [Bacteroidota bacterium]|nr:hypothetical protein [Bacteroidota bacterium]